MSFYDMYYIGYRALADSGADPRVLEYFQRGKAPARDLEDLALDLLLPLFVFTISLLCILTGNIIIGSIPLIVSLVFVLSLFLNNIPTVVGYWFTR